MSLSLFEIVVLSNGDIALQRADDDAAPLIRISFSDEVQEFLSDAKMDVAKVMIDAGIDLFEELGTENLTLDDGESDVKTPRVLH